MDLTQFQLLHVSVRLGGAVVFVEFDHGKANEMGSGVLKELELLAGQCREDSQVVALVSCSRRVSRKGRPIFVAGADVTERQGWSNEQVKEHVRWQRGVLAALRRVPVFHIGVVHGIALGWGTEYLLTCDYRIACPGAVFGLPETGLGILPGAGGTSHLWREIGLAQCLRLGMTGERIDVQEALSIGLVQESASDLDAAIERAMALCTKVARCSPTSVSAFKQAVLASVEAAGVTRELEAQAYEHCVDTGNAALGRENFSAILKGKEVPWTPRVLLFGEDESSKG